MRTKRAQRQSTETESLLDFVPRISKRFESPRHLPQLTEFLERIQRREEVRGLFSVPRRHAKTETVLHGIAWLLANDPTLKIGYASYSETFARGKSRLARDYTRAAGVRLRTDSTALDEWHTIEGGGLIARGMEGAWTGLGVDVLIVDDPHKNRAEANSPVKRGRVLDWWHSAGISSLEPGGSALVVHTRWHVNDLIGHLSTVEDGRWEYHNLPAINDGSDPRREVGEALWPERWPVNLLEARKKDVTEYEWASLYQGHPRPRGGAIFNEPSYYDELPETGRWGHGTDLAYSVKTYADYSVVVTMLRHGSVYYVVDVLRRQCDAPTFAVALRARGKKYGGPIVWHGSGTEKGVAQFMTSKVPGLQFWPATSDKLQRSQPVAAAWNDGRVLLPTSLAATGAVPEGHEDADRQPEWLDPFLTEVQQFTGVNDDHDDHVDALASAFTALQVGMRQRRVRNLPNV